MEADSERKCWNLVNTISESCPQYPCMMRHTLCHLNSISFTTYTPDELSHTPSGQQNPKLCSPHHHSVEGLLLKVWKLLVLILLVKTHPERKIALRHDGLQWLELFSQHPHPRERAVLSSSRHRLHCLVPPWDSTEHRHSSLMLRIWNCWKGCLKLWK